eukprot:CAMPEP_0196667362 /NCGR_PEP_ID=MMETSP1086-20130531/65042_1 /TAXON_ID=77921 /ORGANISM="Cyanoptyche  gloeocystis , Strain SAG4.97" /LENGTH=162 /DNA_ID=CAMNT_0042004687 /DNA_START=46 /DNA_END=536 /DNA_ORIENTATION=+
MNYSGSGCSSCHPVLLGAKQVGMRYSATRSERSGSWALRDTLLDRAVRRVARAYKAVHGPMKENLGKGRRNGDELDKTGPEHELQRLWLLVLPSGAPGRKASLNAIDKRATITFLGPSAARSSRSGSWALPDTLLERECLVLLVLPSSAPVVLAFQMWFDKR